MTSKATATQVQECNNKRQALSQLRRIKWQDKIKFKTKSQKKLYDTIESKTLTFCAGPAGTGKSFISLYYALKDLSNKATPTDGIVLCRPLVSIDNESIGYLPGNVDEKVDPHMLAYWQSIEKLIGKQRAQVLVDAEVIKVLPLAFFRGITLENKIVIYDEAQNSTPTAMKSFLTRLGENSKMIVMGDVNQSDLKKVSGLEDAIKRLIRLNEVGFSGFTKHDIVRHGLIEKILDKYEEDNKLYDSVEYFLETLINKHADKAVYKNGNGVKNGA